MALYTNTHHERRYWPDVRLVGSDVTVELDPGETVDVDVRDDFDDPYLKPANPPRSSKAKADTPESHLEEEDKSDDH